jgi:hypothetical protein
MRAVVPFLSATLWAERICPVIFSLFGLLSMVQAMNIASLAATARRFPNPR